MLLAVLVGVSLSGLHMSALAVNRCIASDGAVTFQEASCPISAKSSTAVKTWDNSQENSGRSAAVPPIKFSASKSENATLAAGALEVLVTNARDCRVELKVRPEPQEATRSCAQYLAQRRAWWAPAINELASSAKDEQLSRLSSKAITSATQSIDKVNEAHAFIKLKMGLRQ